MRIGIDLGGTKTEGAVLGDDDVFIERRRVATPSEDYAAICDVIADLVEALETDVGVTCTVGVAMPGALSPTTGLVKNANTVSLIGQSFSSDLAQRLGRAVRIENDANCFVISEAHDGAARGDAVVFGIIVGTGTGGGLFANGLLVRGANAIGGEWGHNRVPWDVSDAPVRACYCGRRHCVETYLSGPGLLRTYAELGGGSVAGVEDVVVASLRGDLAAESALERYAQQFAQALATVINVFDPDTVVIGGGVSNLPRVCENVGAALPAYVFSDDVVTRLVTARYGDSSGVRGAAWLWDKNGGPSIV